MGKRNLEALCFPLRAESGRWDQKKMMKLCAKSSFRNLTAVHLEYIMPL